ncbi:unnamed protein product [Rotaria sp. Silwood1]|nr:unnamed protein product [Rotaria sp. Silwood1]
MSSATANGIHHTQTNGHNIQQDQIPFNIEQLTADFDLAGQDECNSSARMFERTRIQVLADERGYVQKKTFTKWVNSHLTRVGCRINDLYTDLADGRMLIRLLEILSGERLPKATRGKMRIHCLENVDKAIMFLQEQHVHLENIGAHDIVDGNSSLILGLIWTIILRFQIQDITIEEYESTETKSAKDALLLWCQMKTADYSNVNVRNFTTSWKDGLAFCALIHKHRPDLIPQYKTLTKDNPNHNLQLAFDICEKRLGISRLLDPEDVNVEYIDEKSIITYIVTLYHYFSKMKNDNVQGRRLAKVIGSALDSEKMANEYERLVSDLLIWIEQTIRLLNDRQFPNSLIYVHEKLVEFNRYRVMDKPAQRANQQIPYQPREGKMISDINRAWENLERAEHERELALREEILRQERLEQLATKFNRKAGLREKWLTDSEKLVARHDQIHRINKLNHNWAQLRRLVDKKRDDLSSTFGVQTFHIECNETISWIQDKIRIVQSTEDLGRDLGGVMTMQRRLSGLERDMAAIQSKLDQLELEASKLEKDHPEEATDIHNKVNQINSVWYELKEILRRREESMGEAAELQKFLRDLDHFSAWLTRTQTLVASEDIPNTLSEAEQLLNQHQTIKEEIDRYGPEYAQMKEYGHCVIRDADTTDPQYIFLRERLNALDDGWNELDQMWHQKKNMLTEAMQYQMFVRDSNQAEILLNHQEAYLAREREQQPKSLDDVEGLIKKHEDFFTTMSANEDKIQGVCSFAQRLCQENHYLGDRILSRASVINDRYAANRQLAVEMNDKLQESLKYFQFIQDCDDLKEWLDMKTLQAQDDTYRDTANIHTKYLRHQAFQAEINSNKERLLSLKQNAEQLKSENYQQIDKNLIDQRINELDNSWIQLEEITREKGERLFDANRSKLFQQSITNLDEFMLNIEKHLYAGEPTSTDLTDGQIAATTTTTTTTPALEPLENNLTATNLLLLKQTTIEEELLKRQQQVDELRTQAEKLKQLEPEKSDEIDTKRLQVEEKFSKLLLPLEQKKLRLEQQKHLHQYIRDIEDEQIWLSEKRHLLQTYSDLIFNNKQQTLMNIKLLKRKNETLLKEIENHEQRLLEYLNNECIRVSHDYPLRANELQERLEQLIFNYNDLKQTIKQRRQQIELLENLYQYYYDLSDAEAWLGEQELYMMNEERGKDELTTQTFIRQQQTIDQTIDNYQNILHELNERAKNLLDNLNQSNLSDDFVHEHTDLINKRQIQLDKLYGSLKDLSIERRQKLDETLKLYRLNKEIDDLEQWISDRELIAGSHELGQDFEHVSMLLDRFVAFEQETQQIGNERLQYANNMIDNLISNGHIDSAQIAELKDSLNESYQDLLELIDTRLQSLKASWELQKFLHDCKEILLTMQERKNSIPDEIGRDQQSVQQLLRKHQQFETELVLLAQDIQRIQQEAKRLNGRYAGEKETEIKQKEFDVLTQWKLLQQFVDQRKRLLNDYEDLHRFFGLARDLHLWMDVMIRQMNNSDRPHDVSGVDLLMNNHQSLKAEIDARQENFIMCINLGKDLINRRHVRSSEVKDKCIQLSMLRDHVDDTWNERWEYLQLILEVYQFARDAAIAETWLIAQESYLANEELGDTLDQVENLIKRHEQFEKSLLAQEDRFNALRNLTTLEKKRQLPPVEPRQSRLPLYLEEFKTWDERDAERPSIIIDKTKIPSTIIEEKTSTDAGRSIILPGKQQSSQDLESINNKQRRSESATRLPTTKEGFLSRKHEWEGYERKATHRAWEKYYTALISNRLTFYKDAKHLKTGRTITDDLPLDSSTNVAPATDYRKKPNVFRLKFQDGNEYLFHARDDIEMNEWIMAINNYISSSSSITNTPTTQTTQIPSVALTSPPTIIGPSSSSSTSSPHHQPASTMISSTTGMQMSQTSSGGEQKSRTLPLRSSSSVEPQVSSSSSQQPPTGKKKSGGFFSMKRK